MSGSNSAITGGGSGTSGIGFAYAAHPAASAGAGGSGVAAALPSEAGSKPHTPRQPKAKHA